MTNLTDSLKHTLPASPLTPRLLLRASTAFYFIIRLWRLEAEGYNCGEEVSTWLDTYLKNSGHKLVCYTPDLEPKRNFEDPKWGTRAGTHDQVCELELMIS